MDGHFDVVVEMPAQVLATHTKCQGDPDDYDSGE
jgi:hypothetical protein